MRNFFVSLKKTNISCHTQLLVAQGMSDKKLFCWLKKAYIFSKLAKHWFLIKKVLHAFKLSNSLHIITPKSLQQQWNIDFWLKKGRKSPSLSLSSFFLQINMNRDEDYIMDWTIPWQFGVMSMAIRMLWWGYLEKMKSVGTVLFFCCRCTLISQQSKEMR